MRAVMCGPVCRHGLRPLLAAIIFTASTLYLESSAEVDVQPLGYVRVALQPEDVVANGLERISRSQRPGTPSWISYDQDAQVLYGRTPPSYDGISLTVYSVNRTHSKASSLVLGVDPVDQTPSRSMTLHVTNLNVTTLVGEKWQAFVDVLDALSNTLDTQLNGNSLRVFDVRLEDPNARNLPPILFSPPIYPPNAWVNSSAIVDIVVDGAPLPSCTTVQQLTEQAFLAEGIDIDFEMCSVGSLSLSVETEPSSDPVEPSVRDWNRSRDIFNETVVPAIVIAVILLVIGLIIWIIHSCTKSTDEQLLLQRERLILNKLARNRAFAFRMENLDPSAQKGTAPRYTYLGTIQTGESPHLGRPLDAELDLPPPRYHAPPQHYTS